jgi:5-methylcytosine-specific restriction enzyme subunit McrC
MLSEVIGETGAHSERALLSDNGLRLGAIAAVFVAGLRRQLNHRRTHVYRMQTTEGPRLRGRVIFPRDAFLKMSKPGWFATASVDRVADTAENRFTVFVLTWLRHRVAAPLQREIEQLKIDYLADVATAPNWRAEWSKIRWDKMPASAKAILYQGRDILEGRWPGLLSGLNESQNQVVFTSALFENYFASRINRLFSGTPGLSAATNRSLGAIGIWQGGPHDGTSAFTVRPDVLLSGPDRQPTLVLDTKWKSLDPSQKTLGISEKDLYQLIVYALRTRVTRAVLVFPWLEDPRHALCNSVSWLGILSAVPIEIGVLAIPLAGEGLDDLDARIIALTRPPRAIAMA